MITFTLLSSNKPTAYDLRQTNTSFYQMLWGFGFDLKMQKSFQHFSKSNWLQPTEYHFKQRAVLINVVQFITSVDKWYVYTTTFLKEVYVD